MTRQFVSRAVRQSDASYRFDFRHDLRFGGLPEPRRTERRARPRIASVSIEGDTAIGEAEVRERFRLDPGDTYDFFQIRRGIRRLEERYRERGRLESRVRLERTVRARHRGPGLEDHARTAGGSDVRGRLSAEECPETGPGDLAPWRLR